MSIVRGTITAPLNWERGKGILKLDNKTYWITEFDRENTEAMNLQVGERVRVTLRGKDVIYILERDGGESEAAADSDQICVENVVSPPSGQHPQTTDITVKEQTLPDTVEGLQQFILVTNERLKLYHAKLNAVTKLNLAQAIRQQTLIETQKVGEALLWAEAKLGELLAEIEPKRDKQSSTQRTSLPSLPQGISKKQSHYAQQLAEHPELIRETITEAKENEDIPTRTEVLHKIKDLERENKPEPTPQEPVDTGIEVTCTVCKETLFLFHLADGKHRLKMEMN